MLYHRPSSPLSVLGLIGCVVIAIATGFYVASTQFWSGTKVADLDVRGGSATVALEPAMNPVRVILHREGRRLRSRERAGVEITLRDAAGAGVWTERKDWRGRSSKSNSRGSGRSSSILTTFDVAAPGEYRFESAFHASDGYEPSELRLEVRRQVSRVNSVIVWTGVIGAAFALVVGIVGAKLTGG